jgi:hypothetical protein
MTKITGGVISVEDGIKKAEEYTPARKVRVELHFDVPEGEDAQVQIDFVSARADEQVRKLLGKVNDKERLADAAGIGSTAQAAAAAPAKPVKAAGARTAATKPKPEPMHPAEALARTAELQTAARAQLAAEEAARLNPPAEVDPFATDEPVAEITDADLASAASKKAGEIKTPAPIKKLVGEFRPAGHSGQFSLQQIPRERRQEFLDKLAAVKAA